MSNCETKSACCEPTEKTAGAESCCACGTCCGSDPVVCGSNMWQGSFFQAMKSVQTDILKVKIQKAWGPKMDKAADAVLEAMEAKWKSMMSESQAKAQLYSKLQHIWSEK